MVCLYLYGNFISTEGSNDCKTCSQKVVTNPEVMKCAGGTGHKFCPLITSLQNRWINDVTSEMSLLLSFQKVPAPFPRPKVSQHASCNCGRHALSNPPPSATWRSVRLMSPILAEHGSQMFVNSSCTNCYTSL